MKCAAEIELFDHNETAILTLTFRETHDGDVTIVYKDDGDGYDGEEYFVFRVEDGRITGDLDGRNLDSLSVTREPPLIVAHVLQQWVKDKNPAIGEKTLYSILLSFFTLITQGLQS